MKVLQAFDFLSLPHGGGTVDIVYKLSKALAARGHDITICTGDHEIDYKYLSGLGDVGLRMYHSYYNKHGIYLMPDLVRLDVRDYDLIHLHCYRSIQNIVLANKAIARRVPYIIDAHGSTVARSGKKTLLLDAYDRLAGKRLIDHARFVIAETGVGVAEWERLGAARGKIRLQHPLLDTSEFSVLPEKGLFRQGYLLDNRFVVIFVGRIHPIKSIDLLVDAVHSLATKGGHNIHLVIVGQADDDSYAWRLGERIQQLGIVDKVSCTGFLSGFCKLSALVDADVLVQPSRNEAGARPSLEAIMCGTPVIVSRDTGAGREIASFGGGLLFKSGDAEELAKAIMQVMDNPEEARARTEKAREWVMENLSLEKQIGQYEELYRETAITR